MQHAIAESKNPLLTARILWAALVGGLIVAGALLGIVISPAQHPHHQLPTRLVDSVVFIVLYGALFTVIPIGLFTRGQVLKRGWVGNVITPRAYLTGNIIAWACCEAPAFSSLIFYMITGNHLLLIPYALGFLALVALYPNGKALLPHPPAGADNPFHALR